MGRVQTKAEATRLKWRVTVERETQSKNDRALRKTGLGKWEKAPASGLCSQERTGATTWNWKLERQNGF